MPKRKVTLRLDEETITFIENYAKSKGMTITNVFELAILSMKNKGAYIPKDDLIKFLVNSINSASVILKKLLEPSED